MTSRYQSTPRRAGRIPCVLIAAILVSLTSAAWGQGILVPTEPDIRVQGNCAVTDHQVDITVRNQVASVSVVQTFVNTGSGMLEVEYLFPIPPGAAIDSLTLMVGGQEFAGELMEADKAKAIYEEIVRRKQDPALLEYADHGLYRTRAFPLEVGKPAEIAITYNVVCEKAGQTVEVWYPLSTEKYSAKPVEEITVRMDIEASSDITNLYSPTHTIETERKSDRRIIATYHAENTLPTADIQLFYSDTDKDIGATLLTFQPDAAEDGYFLMLLSANPGAEEVQIVPKDIVLVLDQSGSMNGEKIIQAREAARFIIERLNDEDRFNVIVYDDTIETFFDELVPANQTHRDEALARIDSVTASGGTNIHDALLKAMTIIAADQQPEDIAADGDRPKYVLFLTDGEATVGNTNEADILADTAGANVGTRLFTFGVGYDVNIRLLDKLAVDNRGLSDYVRPEEPIESKVSMLYSRIKNPVMTDLSVEVQGVTLTDIYPRPLGDLFEGSQLVIMGRYSGKDLAGLEQDRNGARTTQVVLKGLYGGEERAFEYPVSITPASQAYPFVSKLWATRRIGWLLDQIQLNGESEEVIDELIDLSLAHGILTPYTSFIADETTDLSDRDELEMLATEETVRLQNDVSGGEGQRAAMTRQAVNTATQVAPASAPASADAPADDVGVAIAGNTNAADYEDRQEERVANVRNVGNQTLYQRGQRWVAANATAVDEEDDADQIQTVARFSDDYFVLVAANTADENAILASQGRDEELMINLRGQVYLIK